MILRKNNIAGQLLFNLYRKLDLYLNWYISPNISFMKHPYYIEIEITNDCNFSCTFCFRRVMNRPIGYMKFEVFKKIIDEVSNYPRHILRIGGVGESALHPDLQKMMDYLRGKNILVDFTTNGTIFSKYSYEEILNWPIDDLGISIDGYDRDSYLKLRKGGDYDHLRDHIIKFSQLKKKLNRQIPNIKIRNVIFPEFKNEDIEYFIKNWMDVADRVTFCTLYTFDVSKETDSFTRCSDIFSTIRIRWDGRIPLCGYGFHFYKDTWIGNVNDERLNQVWNCEKLKEARSMQHRKNYNGIEFCKSCNRTPYISQLNGNLKRYNRSKTSFLKWFSKLTPVG